MSKLPPTSDTEGCVSDAGSDPACDPLSGFFVIARQPGAENPAIPTWANSTPNPAGLAAQISERVRRVDVDGVPGAFQLLNLLTPAECRRLINITEKLGYHADAAVSLPRSVRHNDSFTWVIDDATNDRIWQRCKAPINDPESSAEAATALGLNARYRFYRYGPGDYFAPHTDGAWPGSRVVGSELIDNAYPDRWSRLTFLLFLADDFVGGETQFFVDAGDPARPATRGGQAAVVNVRTPAGGALCFPHGTHPQHCVHSSQEIVSGTKYVIRSDVLFELEETFFAHRSM